MEAKQYVTKQSMDHWRNQRGNQKIPTDKWQQIHDDPKPMRCSKNSSKREVYSNKILPKETRNISNKQPNHTPKAIRDEQKSHKVSRRKEVIKIRSEINEKEMKETIAKIDETKSWFLRR